MYYINILYFSEIIQYILYIGIFFLACVLVKVVELINLIITVTCQYSYHPASTPCAEHLRGANAK